MRLLEVLKDFSLEDALKIEELDKQYLYLKNLYEKIKDANIFLKISVINALLAYQLVYKAEDFWKKFSEFFSKEKIDVCKDFEEFIEKHNFRFKENKLKRLKRICEWMSKVDLLKYKDDLKKLNIDLAKVLDQDINAKTIVFAVKIYGYCLRILGYKITFPSDIFIPIDNRISKISKDKNFWLEISKKLKIPLLHLDSIIWVTYGMSYEEIEKIGDENLKAKMKRLKEFLNNFIV